MKISYQKDASETIIFAARELETYLKRMLDMPLIEIWLESDKSCFKETERDSYRICISPKGGRIVGVNDRSVLLGVYDYLHTLGCRFLMPLKECEIVPSIEEDKLWADYEKCASFYHRGVCIEGADSFENIMNYIEWLPKVGYNSFFLQFKSPYAFLSRWYEHRENPYWENPYAEKEAYTPEDAIRDKYLFEQAAKKRGLMLHEAGHGWTGETLGYQTVSWDLENAPLENKFVHRMAEINGKRALYMGVPANTNLCYHNEDAVDTFAGLVVQYAKENPSVDYLHVWLADEYNNVCECAECRKTTISDQYVDLLNEIDERLKREGLDTRIVFLLYQELLWPPVEKRLHHPERFVLMFAPISRTFEKSYEIDDKERELPEYKRNHITLPVNLAENLAFLRGWQKQFHGEGFVYDYPLGRAHYGDFGYVHIANVIHSDIQKISQMGLDGYMSCQELRAAFPNAFPNYVMGRTLFQKELTIEGLTEEYFSACYGSSWLQVLEYLTELSDLSSCDYVNGKGERKNQNIAIRMDKIKERCTVFEETILSHKKDEGEADSIYWRVLKYHRNYIILFSEVLCMLAMGNNTQAYEKWKKFRQYICDMEPEYQPFLDVYRILEVTQKYTGIKD